MTQISRVSAIDVDYTPPQISGLSDVMVDADAGSSQASNVNLGTTPVATDTGGTATVAGERSDGKALSDPYPVGITRITWTASDPWLNHSYATQKVIVNAPGSILANDATYARGPAMSLKIAIADIAWDVDGNPVSVQSLGASPLRATLFFDSTYIYYLPASDNNDSFTYTVTNTVNNTATHFITVNVATAPGGTAKTLSVSGGTATIKFFGIPGIQYDVQRATSVNVPWTTLTTTPLEPGTDGSFTFTDTSAPEGSAYYRSVQH
jgi:hypothetical protein